MLLPLERETLPLEREALPEERLTAVARVEGEALREETTEREVEAERAAELTLEEALLKDEALRLAVMLRPAERETPPLAAYWPAYG